MPVSEQTYRAVGLEDPEGRWELHGGRLREKPGMSVEHNDLVAELGFQLRQQLPRDEYRVQVSAVHLHCGEAYFIPDVTIVPTAFDLAQRGRPGSLETYTHAVIPRSREG